MTFDAYKNFAATTVASAPSPPTTGTNLDVSDVSVFPAAPFNATVWPAKVTTPTGANAEIVRVEDIIGSTLLVARQQEGSSARAIVAGDQIAEMITAKTLSDLEGNVAGGAVSSVFGRTGSVTAAFGDYDALGLSGVAQTSHGFTTGALTPVRYNGTAWVKSQADSLADAEVHGIAVASDANTFDLYLPGSSVPTSGATAGVQYLDPSTAGALTATEPSTPGQVVKTVGVYTSATVFLFAPMASLYISASPYAKQILDDSTSVTVATLGYFEIPSDLDGATLYSAEITVQTAPSTSAVTVGVKNQAAAEMFSTNPSIAASKLSSEQSGSTAAVVNSANAGVSVGDVLTVHGTAADSGSADRGLVVWLRFK